MNRKTNIFYSEGEDSKFLTFDNYSEALTGDILATDQKLWPSRFLCLYVKALDGENNEIRNNNKKDFIDKYLVPYYENKLAFLRDNIENSEDLTNIMSLNYLLSLIYFYAGKKSGKEYNYVVDAEKDLFDGTYYNELFTEDNISLNYLSDIIEQDYNGTYADIICTITTSFRYKPTITFNDTEDIDNYYIPKFYTQNTSKLYGWQNETNNGILPYISQNVLLDGIYFDEDGDHNSYYTNSIINTLDVEEYTGENLKFNIVIPLYSVADINTNHVNTNVNDQLTLDGNNNVPLGIYFTGKPIELESYNGMFNTSWSLLISMQFKTFPYSFDITHNFDDSDAIKDAYLTFAEILAKQNETIKAFTRNNNQIIQLQNKINLLETTINNMSTVHNVDDINMNLLKLKKNINASISEVKEQIEELAKVVDANKLRWRVKNN